MPAWMTAIDEKKRIEWKGRESDEISNDAQMQQCDLNVCN